MKPRYYVERSGQAFRVMERLSDGTVTMLAAMASEVAARQAAEALNRGLCEAIAPDGRWTD